MHEMIYYKCIHSILYISIFWIAKIKIIITQQTKEKKNYS